MTAENTVQAKIDAIVRGGLSEATMDCLMNCMESYENWADVLDTPVPDAKRAYIFKKWVCDLSKDIKMQMELKLAMLEAKSAAKGNDIAIAKDDPIGLIFKAANIVLTDEENEEMIKACESGKAFMAGGFDPRKGKPDIQPGGQTWPSGPKEYLDGMRECEMCPANAANKKHLDRNCPHATPEKLAAREKMFKERRATRNAEWEKKKKSRPRKKEKGDEKGDAKMAKQNQHVPIDGTDELAASQLFGGQNKPILLDLAEVMQGGSARSLMAKASPGLTWRHRGPLAA